MLTKEKIKHSLEAAWRLRQMKIYGILLGIFSLVFTVLIVFGVAMEGFTLENLLFGGEILLILLLVYSAVMLPFVLFAWYQYRQLFKHLETYIVHDVTLDKPNTAYFYRGAVYYTVTLELSPAKRIKVDTKPLWSSGIFEPIQLADYNNKTIEVAYSETLDKLIVIEKASSAR